MAKKVKFKNHEVEYDGEPGEVKIKKEGSNEFVVAEEDLGERILIYAPDGEPRDPKKGDMAFTQINPTCFWYFTGTRWVLKCI